MNQYDAVLFDFDGVLVDSEPVHYRCWRTILQSVGLDLTWDDYAQNCIGVSDRDMIHALCQVAARPDLFDAVWSRYGHKKSLFRDQVSQGAVRASAEIGALLDDLAGYRLAVVSSSGRAEVEPALVASGIRDRFQALITREDVVELKPAPEPYLTAARRLGARRPLVVEDSDAGLASGKAAGFDVLRIPSAASTARLVREHLGL